MGIVWKAIDERLERPVAVKQIITQPGLSEQEKVNVRQRAMREARNAARLQHPNAIVVFDVAEHAGEPCLVMEYMPAYSLSALLDQRGTLPVDEVARIGEQVAGALVAAHRASIVHRDVKPGNVLIDENGTAKLTDFGISRAAGDMTLTQTGLIGGTPAYLAPELARGADPTPSSDVFALGATLYHAIEGKPVYGDSENQLALLYSAASGKVVPPSRSGRATALLMNLLRADPEERITMAQARTQLAILAGNGSSASTPSQQNPSAENGKPPWQRKSAANAAAATSQPEHPRTSLFDSVQPSSEPSVKQSSTSRDGNSKRKPIVLGAGIAVVVVAAVILGIVLTSGGADSRPTGAGTSDEPSSSQQTSTTRSAPSNVDSAPVHDFTAAGELVKNFYSDPGSTETWNMLGPQLQKQYGSKEEFADAWSDFELQGMGTIRAYKGKPNSDGTVDMKVHGFVTDDGSGSPVVTVGKLDGDLRIVSDPKDDL